jgi:hypothetical protein
MPSNAGISVGLEYGDGEEEKEARKKGKFPSSEDENGDKEEEVLKKGKC